MKKVRVEIGAVMEVYLDDSTPDEQVERHAIETVTGQVRRLDEMESGIHDPDLYLTNYAMNVLDVEEVDCE